MAAHDRSRRRVAGAVFAFSTTLALVFLAITVTIAARSMLGSPGGAIARSTVWVAVFGFACSIITARSAAFNTSRSARTDITLGVAAGGIALLATALLINGGSLSLLEPVRIGPMIAGALLMIAAPWIARRFVRNEMVSDAIDQNLLSDLSWPTSSQPFGRTDIAVVATGLTLLAAGLLVVLSGGPFGHDESVYALTARSWYEGTPSTGSAIYRPPGLPILGWGVLHVSFAETAFRSVAIVLSLATVAMMWFAGRTMYGQTAAVVGTAVFVMSASFLRRSTEFLNDLAAAGLLLGVLYLLWAHFERRASPWLVVAVAPVGAAAYYVRYGSALGLVVVGLIVALIWRKEIRGSWRQLTLTAVIGGVLLLPHFAYSLSQTGSVFGVFQAARTSVGGGGGGLADYAAWLPERLAGRFGAALMLAGAVYLTVVASRAWKGTRTTALMLELRTSALLLGTATVLTVAVGAFTHGEPRFVFMPLMAVLLVGARALSWVVAHLIARWRIAVLSVVGLALVLGFTSGVARMDRTLDAITSSREVLVDTAAVVRSDAGQDDCSIRSSYVPQLTWYSACGTYLFGNTLPTTPSRYLVVFENGKNQPTGDELLDEISSTGADPIAEIENDVGTIGNSLVFRYADPDSE